MKLGSDNDANSTGYIYTKIVKKKLLPVIFLVDNRHVTIAVRETND